MPKLMKRMIYMVAALLAATLLTGVLCGCKKAEAYVDDGDRAKSESDTAASDTETGETEAQDHDSGVIPQGLIDLLMAEDSIRDVSDIATEPPESGSQRRHQIYYYGTYNGIVVLGIFGNTCDVTDIEIGGRHFQYGNSFSLYAYADGERGSVKKAYEDGILTGADLDAMLEIHKQCVGNAWPYNK